MTSDDFSLLIDKLDSIIFILNSIKVTGLFFIGCTAAVLVILILYSVLYKFFSKF